MTHASVTANDAALQVVQQAVGVLAKWAKFDLPPKWTCSVEYPVVKQVKNDILPWLSGAEPQPLQLLFDQVKLDNGQKQALHYWPVEAVANGHGAMSYPPIPYPQTESPASE